MDINTSLQYDVIDKSDIYVIDPIGVDNLKIKCGDKYDFVEIYIRTPQNFLKREQEFVEIN